MKGVKTTSHFVKRLCSNHTINDFKVVVKIYS